MPLQSPNPGTAAAPPAAPSPGPPPRACRLRSGEAGASRWGRRRRTRKQEAHLKVKGFFFFLLKKGQGIAKQWSRGLLGALNHFAGHSTEIRGFRACLLSLNAWGGKKALTGYFTKVCCEQVSGETFGVYLSADRKRSDSRRAVHLGCFRNLPLRGQRAAQGPGQGLPCLSLSPAAIPKSTTSA